MIVDRSSPAFSFQSTMLSANRFLVDRFLVIRPRYGLFRDLGFICNDRLELHYRAIFRELLPVADISAVPKQLRFQMRPITRYNGKVRIRFNELGSSLIPRNPLKVRPYGLVSLRVHSIVLPGTTFQWP
jgi:hypothetical protein